MSSNVVKYIETGSGMVATSGGMWKWTGHSVHRARWSISSAATDNNVEIKRF